MDPELKLRMLETLCEFTGMMIEAQKQGIITSTEAKANINLYLKESEKILNE